MKFLKFDGVLINTDCVTRIKETIHRGMPSTYDITLNDHGSTVSVGGEDADKLLAWMDQAQWQPKKIVPQGKVNG